MLTNCLQSRRRGLDQPRGSTSHEIQASQSLPDTHRAVLHSSHQIRNFNANAHESIHRSQFESGGQGALVKPK